MERENERTAFAKACAYLNYSPGAKWTAHVAAVGSCLVYIALLGVLWLKRPRARHLARPAGWGCAWLLYALHAAGALTVAIFIVPGLLVVAVSSARDG